MPKSENEYISVSVHHAYLKDMDKFLDIVHKKFHTHSKARLVCMAIRDYVNDDNFDTLKFKKYIAKHPEDKDRIRGFLDE